MIVRFNGSRQTLITKVWMTAADPTSSVQLPGPQPSRPRVPKVSSKQLDWTAEQLTFLCGLMGAFLQTFPAPIEPFPLLLECDDCCTDTTVESILSYHITQAYIWEHFLRSRSETLSTILVGRT